MHPYSSLGTSFAASIATYFQNTIRFVPAALRRSHNPSFTPTVAASRPCAHRAAPGSAPSAVEMAHSFVGPVTWIGPLTERYHLFNGLTHGVDGALTQAVQK